MATLYVHIGMEKTGTTSLQALFSENREALKEQGLIYPLMPPCEGISSNVNGYFLMPKKKEMREECFGIINGFVRDGYNVLLSAETLWLNGAREKEFWEEIKESVEAGTTIKAIAFLRRQDDYIYSRWTETVQRGGNAPYGGTFGEFFKGNAFKTYHLPGLDYAAVLEAMEESLGKENIIVKVYEKEKENLSENFLNIIGIDGTGLHPAKNINLSLSGSVLEAKRLVNKTGLLKASGQYQYFLDAQDRLKSEGKFISRNSFSKTERKEFLKMFEKINAEVAGKYFSEEALFKTNDLEAEENAGGEYTKEELAWVFSAVLSEYAAVVDNERSSKNYYKKRSDELKEKNGELRKKNTELKKQKNCAEKENQELKAKIREVQNGRRVFRRRIRNEKC